MRFWLASVLALTLTAASAHAHFIFIVPGGDSAQVVFSEGLEADENVPIDKISATEFKARLANGKVVDLAKKKGTHAYNIQVPAGSTVAGTCQYGVLQRGDSKPFLLVYHPKLVSGKLAAAKPWKGLPFEVVPLGGDQFQVLFGGKPVAEAEVAVITPAGKEKATANAQGKFKVSASAKGKYALRVRNVVAKPGNLAGKEYNDEKHYATLVFEVGAAGAKGALGAPPAEDKAAPAKEEKEDPAATKLLTEARAQRGNWDDFPGFSANLTVNVDGKTSTGKLNVAADGKLTLEGIDKAALPFTNRFLGSLIMHRRAGNRGRRDTPAAFVDDGKHPQGRLIRLVGDRMNSTYRIRDKQILVVNRDMAGGRFTINVLENLTNEEGKFIPTSWTVSYWDVKSGQLKRSITNRVSWKRIGKYDLPTNAKVVTAQPEENGVGLTTSTLELSNIKLGGK